MELLSDPYRERNTPMCGLSDWQEDHEAYQEPSEEPSHTKANQLTAYGEQKLKTPRHFQVIEWLPLQS